MADVWFVLVIFFLIFVICFKINHFSKLYSFEVYKYNKIMIAVIKMSEGKRRRCQFCWAMVPWKESTVITSSKTGREKWIEALGEGFRNQLEKVGTRRAYICRFHFPSGEVHGRRSVYSLPRLAADGDVADTSNLDFSE
ncbi:Protein CBG23807, partial [Caenorhabditis briggsae]